MKPTMMNASGQWRPLLRNLTLANVMAMMLLTFVMPVSEAHAQVDVYKGTVPGDPAKAIWGLAGGIIMSTKYCFVRVYDRSGKEFKWTPTSIIRKSCEINWHVPRGNGQYTWTQYQCLNGTTLTIRQQANGQWLVNPFWTSPGCPKYW